MLKLPISVKSLGAARYLPVVKLLNGIVGEQMFRQAVACDETLADRVFLCEEKIGGDICLNLWDFLMIILVIWLLKLEFIHKKL